MCNKKLLNPPHLFYVAALPWKILITTLEHLCVFPISMWVVLKKPFFGPEMRIQTWKSTLTADARSDDHWYPRMRSRLHLPSRRRPSSHGERTDLGLLKKITGPKLSRFEPTGPLRLARHDGKVP